MDITEDEKDNDWNFVPTHIISHAKRIIPRNVIKKQRDNQTILQVEREVHLRVQVVWKDKTIS